MPESPNGYALDEPAKVTFTVKRIITRVVRGRKLKPGLYRLIALPVDSAGNTGNAVYVRFRIVR